MTMPDLRQALAFLTPFPGARRPSPKALRWFPVVGVLLGLMLGGLWWVAARYWPAPVAAALVVAADLGLTGLLHLDGLADSADGLLPHLTRDRRLEVMREPTVGSFALGVVVVTLLARWAALSALRPSPLLLAALWCASRTAMAATFERMPYARIEGLSTAFMGARLPLLLALPALAGAAALSCADAIPAGPVALAALLAGFGAVVWLGWRRLGGFTGDVLGAAGVIGETVGLIVASHR